jgi:DNA-binding XRE family transcriptional regulator
VTLKCLKPNGIQENPQTLGEHLLARRLTLKLYQRDVAKMLGVSPWTVIHWETGATTPGKRHWKAVSQFLDPPPSPPKAPPTPSLSLPLAKRAR